jgi:hypothetical protein
MRIGSNSIRIGAGRARIFHILAMRTTSFSLTPCFSWVEKRLDLENRFNGLPHPAETVETVPVFTEPRSTQLKQGVNERDLSASSFDYEISGLATGVWSQ